MSYKMYTLHNVALFQRFSKILQKLKHQNAETVGDLLGVLKSSIALPPSRRKFSTFLRLKIGIPLSYTPPRTTLRHMPFKFELDSNHKCQRYYKLWAQDKQWHLFGKILCGPVPGCSLFLRPLFE